MMPKLDTQVVKDLALDVWEDLGRTRLAGVAVGLVLALVVLTVVAFRPGGGPPDATGSPVIPTTPPEHDVSFTVPGEKPMQLSDVDLSAPRDPFNSLDGLAGSDEQTLLAAGSEIVDSVTGSGSSAGSTTAALSTDGASSLLPLDDLSTTPTPTTPTEPQADFGDGDEADEPAPATDYSYTADVQFGHVNDLKRYTGVQRLGLVPSRSEPLIMFLGPRPTTRPPCSWWTRGSARAAKAAASREPASAPSSSCGRLRTRTSTTSATPTATSTCCDFAPSSAPRRPAAA